jgi:hypothetical protein
MLFVDGVEPFEFSAQTSGERLLPLRASFEEIISMLFCGLENSASECAAEVAAYLSLIYDHISM